LRKEKRDCRAFISWEGAKTTTGSRLGVDRGSQALLPCLLEGQLGDRGVLHADAGQVAHRDLVLVGAARHFPDVHLSESSGDDEAGPAEHPDVQLLFVRAAGAGGGDVGSALHPPGLDQRFVAGDDEVGGGAQVGQAAVVEQQNLREPVAASKASISPLPDGRPFFGLS